MCDVIVFYPIADIMSRATLLYGEQSLLDEYNSNVIKKLYEKSSETIRNPGFTRGIRQVIEDIKTYHPSHSYLSEVAGGLFDTKKHFYRLISLLLTDLGMVFDIRSPSPWQVISKLRNRYIIDESDSANLKVCLSIANEIRLKVYFANGRQKELFSPLSQSSDTPEQSTDHPIFRDFDEDTLVRLLTASTVLHQRCYEFCAKYKVDQKDEVSQQDEVDQQDKVDASVFRKHFSPSKHLVMCQLYFRLQNFPKVSECLKSIPQNSPEYAQCAFPRGVHHQYKGEFKEAIECYETALKCSKDPFDTLLLHRNIANCLNGRFQYKQAKNKFEETIKLHGEIYSEGSEPWILSELMLGLSYLLFDLGDISSTIKTLRRVEKMQTEQIKRCSDKDVMLLNLYMAKSYGKLRQNDQPLDYLNKALRLGHKIYGEHNLSDQLGHIYRLAAPVYEDCGLPDKALSLLERSLKLMESVHGDTPNAGEFVKIKEKWQ